MSEVNNSLLGVEEIHSNSVRKSKQQLSICVLSVPTRSTICFIFTNCNQLNQCVAFPTYLELLVKWLSTHIVLYSGVHTKPTHAGTSVVGTFFVLTARLFWHCQKMSVSIVQVLCDILLFLGGRVMLTHTSLQFQGWIEKKRVNTLLNGSVFWYSVHVWLDEDLCIYTSFW